MTHFTNYVRDSLHPKAVASGTSYHPCQLAGPQGQDRLGPTSLLDQDLQEGGEYSWLYSSAATIAHTWIITPAILSALGTNDH